MAEDKRIAKTKNTFKKALITLIREKNINQISISELCSRAGINRNTFYCHYNYPEEVLQDTVNEIIHEFLNIFNEKRNSFDIINSFCIYLKENREIIEILSSDNCNGQFEKKMVDVIYERMMSELKKENGPYKNKYYDYISAYAINGSIAIMKKWVQSGFKESNEEIIALIINLTNYGTKLNKENSELK